MKHDPTPPNGPRAASEKIKMVLKKKKKRAPELEFEEYTVDDAHKDEEERRASGTGKYYKIVNGKNHFRILPAPPGKKWKRVFYKHFVDLAGSIVSITCPRMETKGKRKCKICEQERKLRATQNPLDEKHADRIRAQRKCIANVIDRKNEEAGPQEWEFGIGIEKDLTEMREVEDVNFTHPINGSDIVIFKTGTKRSDIRYKVKEGDKCQLHEDAEVMRDWIANQGDLESRVRLESDEDIDARLRGENPRDNDKGGGRRRSKDDDDDDDDDDELDLAGDAEEEDDEDDDDEITF